MEQPSISKLQFYSLGVVAANKALSSMTVEITPVEEFPMLDGQLTDDKQEYKADTVDNTGASKSTSVDSTVTIKATWLPINNSNRRTAPDVRRGEKVVLYKFADTDKYWWNTLFNDSVLRRLETVIYAFSDNAKEGPPDTAESTYFLEVSTHRKIMHVHTSKSDGEPFAYDVQINAKDGIVTITDDVGNFFVLNSRDKRLTMQNSDESKVDINGKNILMSSSDSITLISKDINVRSGNNTAINSGSVTSLTSSTNTVNGPLIAANDLNVEGGIQAGGAITSSTSVSSPHTT